MKIGGYGKLRTSTKGKSKKRKTRKDFKTLDGYLNNIYNENKSYLNLHIKKLGANTKTKREIFKDQVKKWMKQINPNTGKPYTVKQAIDKVHRSQTIRSSEERYADIFWNRFKEDKESLDDFRRKVGWKQKLDVNNIIDMTSEYNKNYIRYKDPKTGKDLVIIEEISPKSGATVGYQFEEWGTWREKFLKKKAKNSASAAAELAVQEILNKYK